MECIYCCMCIKCVYYGHIPIYTDTHTQMQCTYAYARYTTTKAATALCDDDVSIVLCKCALRIASNWQWTKKQIFVLDAIRSLEPANMCVREMCAYVCVCVCVFIHWCCCCSVETRVANQQRVMMKTCIEREPIQRRQQFAVVVATAAVVICVCCVFNRRKLTLQ